MSEYPDEKVAYAAGKEQKEVVHADSGFDTKGDITSSPEIEAAYVDLPEAEAKRILRKVDFRLVPVLSLLYLVAFIDRSNSKFPRPV